ncbi:MAG: metallophosphoesterase [Proteobacteria bacterium]|nr:metallophosphoesterase [Pseudomonadota bacterium]
MSEFRIGIIGDLHTHFDEIDVYQFDHSHYDLLCFTGDLGGGSADSTVRIARVMSRLKKPVLVMPGNNDTIDTIELAAELTHRAGLAALTGMRKQDDYQPPQTPNVQVCGYSNHRFKHSDDLDFTVIAARPHSMGGPDLSFPEFMVDTYGIGSMAESQDRLISLVDAAQTQKLIFLSHNGPLGLGALHRDPWGADFLAEGGDWGDPDLTGAIEHAVAIGKQVLAVIAGHMHIRTKQGVERNWRSVIDGVHYVNAARVPRIFSDANDVQRHHLAVTVSRVGIEFSEMLIPQGG